jgi:hypothetical protein
LHTLYFGFILEQDKWTDRPYISDFEQTSSSTSIATDRTLRSQFLRALIMAIDNSPVFTAFKDYRIDNPTVTTMLLTVAVTPLPTQQERNRLTLEHNLELSHTMTTDRAASNASSRMIHNPYVTDVESISLATKLCHQ